ncbi:MAG: PorT family protein [Bacteroidales bacterium]|nr:PorT family protein [Bacteroidales bacterium]
MRRLYLLPVLLTLFMSLHAQKQAFKGELYFGAGGGVMSASVDFMPAIPQMFNRGVYAGVAVKYISEKHLGLVSEINFAQRGWKEEFDPITDFSFKRTLNYIEVPFMTHVYFGKKARFILNAGPQISILIGDKQEMSQALAEDLAKRQAVDPDAPIGVQYGPMDEMNRFDYGLVGGVGMELRTGIGDIDLEGRYYFGLGDVFNSRRSDDAYFSRSAHRLIEAKLTYYLKIN